MMLSTSSTVYCCNNKNKKSFPNFFSVHSFAFCCRSISCLLGGPVAFVGILFPLITSASGIFEISSQPLLDGLISVKIPHKQVRTVRTYSTAQIYSYGYQWLVRYLGIQDTCRMQKPHERKTESRYIFA